MPTREELEQEIAALEEELLLRTLFIGNKQSLSSRRPKG